MNRSNTCLLVVFLSLLLSCELETDVNLDLPPFEPAWSLVGFVGPGSPIELSIQAILPPQTGIQTDMPPPLAEGEIFVDGKRKLSFLPSNDSLIQLPPLVLTAGQRVHLHIQLANGDSIVSEEDIIPEKAWLSSASYSFEDSSENVIHLDWDLGDKPQTGYLAVKLVKIDSLGSALSLDETYRLASPFGPLSDVDNFPPSGRFSFHRFEPTNLSQSSPLSGAWILLYSLSETSYAFFQSLNLYDFTYGDIYQQQIPVYTNLSNKLGLFGAYQVDSLYVPFE